MEAPNFYLVANEAIILEYSLKCWILDRFKYGDRDDYFLVKVSPPIIYKNFQKTDIKLEQVVLVARYYGKTLAKIKKWPVYVNLMKSKMDLDTNIHRLVDSDLEIIALGKIYPSIKVASREAQKAFEQSNKEYWLHNT